MVLHRFRLASRCALAAIVTLTSFPALGQEAFPPTPPPPSAQQPASSSITAPPVTQKITAVNTKIEMTVNGSRILTMDSEIPRAQVGNPELLAFTVISANEVQIHAKKPGITTVNLWDKNDEVHTVDVVVVGDVRELEGLLKSQFPTAALKLYPTQSSTLVLSGYVDRPDHVNTIMRISEDYYPKVINNMIVGGTQQVLLHVKIMEVSRTQLKNIGFDWAYFSNGGFLTSTASGAVTTNAAASLLRGPGSFGTNAINPPTMSFGLVNDSSAFLGFLEALKRENLVKILAEPNLVTVSGRPATYQVGGEIPFPQPTGFGNISIQFKPFGTMIDFVPIVLGNGSVRLEVRPQVLEKDDSLGILILGTAVPGFTTRSVDTGVEMKFGQTLAIAGLLQQRTKNEKRGVPYLMDMPYVGAAFRRNSQEINEVELLIMVRPELVEAMDPDQVPNCGPGLSSQSPDDQGLYWKGYIETPVQPYGPNGHGPDGHGPNAPGNGGGMGPDDAGPNGPAFDGPVPEQVPAPTPAIEPGPTSGGPAVRKGEVVISDRAVGTGPPISSRRVPQSQAPTAAGTRGRTYNPPNPQQRQGARTANSNSKPPGFIGPIGYDVKK
jgi:pilus assembly protein CpaC